MSARLACAADPNLADAWRCLARLLSAPEEVFYRLEDTHIRTLFEQGVSHILKG